MNQTFTQQKNFPGNLLAIEIEKTQKFINKLVNIGLSILEMGKTVMHEFWYDFVKPKYEGKAK